LLDELGELAEWIRFDATVTVVDALNCDVSLKDYAIATDQITAADVLILNKSDLVDKRQLRDLRQRLQQLNPHAPMVVSCWGDVNPAMIFEVEDRLAPEATNTCVPPTEGEGRQPPYTHAHDHLWSRTMRLSQVLDRQAFLKMVAALPPSIFRIKGLIELSDPRQTLLFQYVAGRWDINPFSDSRVQERFLTFIGKTDELNSFQVVEELIRAAEA
jgi:G3E family GTPase